MPSRLAGPPDAAGVRRELEGGHMSPAGRAAASSGRRRRNPGRIGLMSELKERLRADLTASMKDRDEIRTRTLRMVLSEISKEEVSGQAARELDDAAVQRVVAREAKRRREAAEACDEAGTP